MHICMYAYLFFRLFLPALLLQSLPRLLTPAGLENISFVEPYRAGFLNLTTIPFYRETDRQKNIFSSMAREDIFEP